MSLVETDLIHILPRLMVESFGDLAKVSRSPAVHLNAMELRKYVANTPEIRRDYHRLLQDELQESHLHIAERILRMADLQDKAFGDEDIPPDPKAAIEISKEISRLIKEGKDSHLSQSAAQNLASKEDVREVLERFLGS